MNNQSYQLFFIKNHPNFPDGTLFELENTLYSHAQISKAANEKRQEIADWEYETKGYLLPDRGDGLPTVLSEKNIVICPPFPENIPPGKGVIQITKTTTRSRQYPDAEAPSNVPVGILSRNQVSVFQNIHFQRLYIELPSDREELEQITVFDKVKQWETECYYSPKIKQEEGKWRVECEFSHITFGFYEVQIQFTSGWYYRIDLVKHYPEYLKDKYQVLIKQNSTSGQSMFTPLKEIGFDLFNYHLPNVTAPIPVTNEIGFSDEVLNDAMEMSIEWGENYRQPIYERLHKKYPEINAETAEKIQKHCREAESYIYSLGEKELNGEISQADIVPLAQRKYPWVKVKHWYRLKNIAMFYARK
jgi:hypothetical protein